MTVSEVIAARAASVADGEGAGARARARVIESVTDGDREAPSWLFNATSTVADDWRNAWLWDAEGITVRNLWAARMPSLEDTPGEVRALWLAWLVYNHAVLAAVVPLLFVAWVLCHPARLLYTAPVAVPLTLLWLT